MKINHTLLAAAVSGIVMGVTGCGGDKPPAATGGDPAATSGGTMPASTAVTTGAKHDCKGKNDCKGQGGCKGDHATCKAGQNACKGQGGCKSS